MPLINCPHCGKPVVTLPVPPRPCAACGLPYAPGRATQRYCGPACQRKGLEAAVARQRGRRAELKAAKEKEAKEKMAPKATKGKRGSK